MQQLQEQIKLMIDISGDEMAQLIDLCYAESFERRKLISKPGKVTDEVYFINKGIVRVIIADQEGNEHTIHFAPENMFVTDYASFLQKTPSQYYIQAIEDTEVTVLPRAAVEWGYQNLRQGDRLGRLIAESYFVYHDERIKNMYAMTPKERYDSITQVFPDIHNRVPQHMIASYLGVTPVPLSRLKKSDIKT